MAVEITPFTMVLTHASERVIEALIRAGFEPMIVGGAVRDQLLGHVSKDIDIEVYGASNFDDLITALKPVGKCNLVGRNYGVLKITVDDEEFDVSLPRTESKVGKGHKGFKIEVEPNLSKFAATARRDFTFNALMWNPTTSMIEDYHGGMDAMANSEMIATSEAFSEDPLRVLRAVQFAARFSYFMDTSTLEACRSLSDEYSTIPVESIRTEMQKFLRKGRDIEAGMEVLKSTGWDRLVFGDFAVDNAGNFDKIEEIFENMSFIRETTVDSGVHEFLDLAVAIAIYQNTDHDEAVVENFVPRKIAKRAIAVSECMELATHVSSNSDARYFALRLHKAANLAISEFITLSSIVKHYASYKLGVFADEAGVMNGFEKDFFNVKGIVEAMDDANRPTGRAIGELADELRAQQYARD